MNMFLFKKLEKTYEQPEVYVTVSIQFSPPKPRKPSVEARLRYEKKIRKEKT